MIHVLNRLSLSSISNSFMKALNVTTQDYHKTLLMMYFLVESVVLATIIFSAIFFLPCITTLTCSEECCLKPYLKLTRGKTKHLCFSLIQKDSCCARRRVEFGLARFLLKKSTTAILTLVLLCRHCNSHLPTGP